MTELFEIFSNPNFMPHGHCYLWRTDILMLNVLSDAVLSFAYISIPIVMWVFLYRQRGAIPFAQIVALLVAVFFLCAITHLWSIVVVWYPLYEIQGWLKAVTAITSIFTAIVMLPKIPGLIALPGIEKAYEEAQRALEKARKSEEEMQSVYQIAIDREERILSLKREVNELLASQQMSPRYVIEGSR